MTAGPHLLHGNDLWHVELEHVLDPELQRHHGAGTAGASSLRLPGGERVERKQLRANHQPGEAATLLHCATLRNVLVWAGPKPRLLFGTGLPGFVAPDTAVLTVCDVTADAMA